MKEKIYHVRMSDGDNYEPLCEPIGYFTTLEKANEAAKKYAESKFKNGFEVHELDDGRREYFEDWYYICIDIINLDEYLISF